MNSTKVILTITRGSLEGKQFVFEEPTECVVGRAADCKIPLPQDWEHMNVSRHHCAFAIDPPMVWVRDLASHNGTFVNGDNIGQASRRRSSEQTPREGVAYELNNGDEVRVGSTVFRVGIANDDDMPNPGIVPLYFL
jgi:eukaryotic-like serine/threonine-protein kinase